MPGQESMDLCLHGCHCEPTRSCRTISLLAAQLQQILKEDLRDNEGTVRGPRARRV